MCRTFLARGSDTQYWHQETYKLLMRHNIRHRGSFDASVNSYLPLTGDTHFTEGILIFQTLHLRLLRYFHWTLKGIAFRVLKVNIRVN